MSKAKTEALKGEKAAKKSDSGDKGKGDYFKKADYKCEKCGSKEHKTSEHKK